MTALLHLGLGNFFRAHQAWFSARAGLDYVAFSGRTTTEVVRQLRGAGGRYALVTRGPEADAVEEMRLAAVHPGDDEAAWLAAFTAPDLQAVTLTVTEAGYSGGAMAKLAAGFAARRQAGLGPLWVVPCDNLPGNGGVVHRAVLAAAEPGLRDYLGENLRAVSTMVDRITPASADPLTVVTEPFAEWVVTGGPAEWAGAGVTFTDDVTPFERRKLLLLNGGHSLLAYGGLQRGLSTVAGAFADGGLRAWLEEWWDDASALLGDTAAYRTALRARFANARMEHRLEQIAADGSQKLPVRILPVPGEAGERVVEAWGSLLRNGFPLRDVRLDEVRAIAADGVEAVLRVLGEPARD